jgi:TolB protein
MISVRRISCIAALGLSMSAPALAFAQDTTAKGITLVGNYDPLRGKTGIVVLPIADAFGDSIRTIIQRDLDYSDRFTVIPVDTTDPTALRGGGAGGGLDYTLFSRIAASVVAQVTPVATGLHLSMHDVAKGQVVGVVEMPLPMNGLSRDWRLAVHRVSDEIERWVTGQKGIAATRIAYIRGQSIRMVDSDGAGEITVPTEANGLSPAWNPAGTMLAYATAGADSRVYLLDLSTGRSRMVVASQPSTNFITPTFSPDGTQLLYTRSEGDRSDIYTVRAAGGDTPRRLTVSGIGNTGASMSPDGRRIVYVNGILGRPELYIMDSDGTGARDFTDYNESDKNYRSDPDWSPDGRQIAYQERINNRFQITTIRATGSTPKTLTSDGENEQPSWAPDGRHLVFTSTRSGVRQLWVLDIESNRVRQLTKSAGSRMAAWSPRLAGQ